MARVFISYRREDGAAYAGRIHDRLAQEFGRDALFMDVDAIPLGSNFIKVLNEEVAKCGVLLAVIAPGWLDARDEAGARRLDDENDFVRVEIAAALKRDIPVIPILLEGATPPRKSELPTDLEDLSVRNGLEVRHSSFHGDLDKLIRGISEISSDGISSLVAAKATEVSHDATDQVEVVRPVGDKSTELAGVSVNIIFTEARRADALGMKALLEHHAAMVKLLITSDQTMNGVIFFGRGLSSAAEKVRDVALRFEARAKLRMANHQGINVYVC